jgi:1,2-diacylglycerol 3-alpha-glucosyltransferase
MNTQQPMAHAIGCLRFGLCPLGTLPRASRAWRLRPAKGSALMRIGFFTDTYTPQINGVVTSIRLFKHALEERGHDVFVFAPTPDTPEDADDTVRFRSMPFVFQPEMRVAAPVSLEALRLLDEVELDVVHAHDPFAIGLFGLQVARRHKIPYVHTYHTLYPEYVHYVWETRLTKRVAERLSREYCEACDSIVAPSSKIEDYLREWGVKRPIEIIATGVDVEKYSVVDEEHLTALRKRLRLKAEDRVALFMGRLGREKNVEALIRAMWHCRNSNAKLVICGDGPHRGDLEDLVDELSLKNRVIFAGYLEGKDTVAAYHLAHIFAFASTSETQGLVVGEAMAAGLPVVAASDRAVEDFVVDGECGLIVPGRPEDLAHAFDALFNDEARRLTLSKAAEERARVFSIQRQAEKLETHYLRDIELYEPHTILPRIAALSRTGLPGATGPRIPGLRRKRPST